MKLNEIVRDYFNPMLKSLRVYHTFVCCSVNALHHEKMQLAF